jgi:hypothetical protein
LWPPIAFFDIALAISGGYTEGLDSGRRGRGQRLNQDLRARRLLIAQRSIGDLQRMSSSVVLRFAAIVAFDQSSKVRLKLRLVSSLAPFIGMASSCLFKSRFFVSGRATEVFSGAA